MYSKSIQKVTKVDLKNYIMNVQKKNNIPSGEGRIFAPEAKYYFPKPVGKVSKAFAAAFHIQLSRPE